MTQPAAQAVQGEAVRQYIRRIDAHLARLAAGHDPLGHFFGIERLARAARSETHVLKASGHSERGAP